MCSMHGKSLAGLSSSCRLLARASRMGDNGCRGNQARVHSQTLLNRPWDHLQEGSWQGTEKHPGAMSRSQVGWRKVLECGCTPLRSWHPLTALPDF